VRSVFIVDPQRKVRVTLTYPPSVGRNIDEILRTIDALQLTDQQPVATPVNWLPGEDIVVSPKLSDADAAERFTDVRKLKPYLRFAKAAAKSPVEA